MGGTSPTLAIIDYDAGNTRSVMHALDRLDVAYELTADRAAILAAPRVIFPGVGHAGAAMQTLRDRGLDTVIPAITAPVLGICVGMQLFCATSEESETPCLGILPLNAQRFRPEPDDEFINVPHMGWNQLGATSGPLFAGIEADAFVYFVHSYHVPHSEYSVATTHYNHPFAAAVQRDNFYGVQFHPEKSSTVGAALLRNFMELS